MKYIKKFSTDADYQAFKSSTDYIEPNVSAIEENSSVIYEPIKTQVLQSFIIFGSSMETKEFNFVEGMTWIDFINTPELSQNLFTNNGGYVRYWPGGSWNEWAMVFLDSIDVSINDVIINGTEYWAYTGRLAPDEPM